jgi:hypothetical protein
VGFLIVMIGFIYVRRRQRLQLQQRGQITTDRPRGPVTTTRETGEASGSLTPFTLPSPISQLHTPLTKSRAITVPPSPTQTGFPNEPSSTQAARARRQDDSEGRDALAEAMQQLQERVAYLEGRSSGEGPWERRPGTISTPSQSEGTFRIEETLDPPPMYKA